MSHGERTYILRDDGVRARCLRTLTEINLAQCWEVVIRPWRAKRSDEQNALFHVIVSKVATATGNDPEDVKSYLKGEFGPKRAVVIHGETRMVPKESSSYTAEEMSEMIDRAREWAALEWGIEA